MIETITAFLKKYYPLGVLAVILLIFSFLTKAPEADAQAEPVYHTLVIESYPEETETETKPKPRFDSDVPAETTIVSRSAEPEPTEPETETPSETETEQLLSAENSEEIQTETELITEPETEPDPTELPDEVLLDIPYYSQKNFLPTGCETMSAKMLLEYYLEEEVPVQNIIDLLNCKYPEEIGGEVYAPNPAEAFIGSPWDDSSFGCYAPVIVNALNQLLPEGYEAIETTGTDLQELAETYLPQGIPVLVWETTNMVQTHPTVGWYLLDEDNQPTDQWYQWLANEHCMVLAGYNDTWYFFNDPYENHGTIGYHRDISEVRYEEQGKYSAVILTTEE